MKPDAFQRIKSGEYMLDISISRIGNKITGLGQIWRGRSIFHGFYGGRYGIPTVWESEAQAFVDLRVYALGEMDTMDLPEEFAHAIQFGDEWQKEVPSEISTEKMAESLLSDLEKGHALIQKEISTRAWKQLNLF